MEDPLAAIAFGPHELNQRTWACAVTRAVATHFVEIEHSGVGHNFVLSIRLNIANAGSDASSAVHRKWQRVMTIHPYLLRLGVVGIRTGKDGEKGPPFYKTGAPLSP